MDDKKITILSIYLNDLKEKFNYLSAEYQEHLNESVDGIENAIKQVKGGEADVDFLIQNLQLMESIVNHFNQQAQNEALQKNGMEKDLSVLYGIYRWIGCFEDDIKHAFGDVHEVQEEQAIKELTLAWDKAKESYKISNINIAKPIDGTQDVGGDQIHIEDNMIEKINLIEFHEDKENPYYDLPQDISEVINSVTLLDSLKHLLRNHSNASDFEVIEKILNQKSELSVTKLLRKIRADIVVHDMFSQSCKALCF